MSLSQNSSPARCPTDSARAATAEARTSAPNMVPSPAATAGRRVASSCASTGRTTTRSTHVAASPARSSMPAAAAAPSDTPRKMASSSSATTGSASETHAWVVCANPRHVTTAIGLARLPLFAQHKLTAST
jgi:hypothetical protein